jgi:flagellar basal-body rod modification protein FlgD
MSILNIASKLNATSNSGNSTSNPNGQTGFAALTSQDFLKMLITELKNQDPTQPVSNAELLQQLSQMQALQSNVELKSTLQDFANNQQVSSGASFLGKQVSGTDSRNNPVSGVADRVFLQDGTLMIGVGSSSLSIANVTGVSLVPQ